MKTLFKSLCLLTIILLSLNAAAQAPVFDINGLVLGDTYTKAQVIAKLGQPTRIDTWPDDFGGYGQEFRYDKASVTLNADGEFTNFSISSPSFKVIGGTIKVGDPISKVANIAQTKCYVEPDKYMLTFLASPDNYIAFNYKNGIITCIHGFVPN